MYEGPTVGAADVAVNQVECSPFLSPGTTEPGGGMGVLTASSRLLSSFVNKIPHHLMI